MMQHYNVIVDDVWVRYSSKQEYVLKGVSLRVRDAEILGLLGPSGSGKSTLLKAIAGLVEIDRGRIFLSNRDVTRTAAHKRNVGVVFQSFALFPHMTVLQNIEYGLKIRKVSGKAREEKVKSIIKLLGLEGLENRYPSQLSGGQQQRVALGRALAIDPSVILLDEPMSNIDPIFRGRLREELRRILKEKEVTAIYVTHDRQDAFEVCDRIAIMRDGVIEQVGYHEELFSRPRNIFVAEFIGLSNIVKVSELRPLALNEMGDTIKISLSSGELVLPKSVFNRSEAALSIPPWKINITANPNMNSMWIRGKVTDTAFTGDYYKVTIETEIGPLSVHTVDAKNIVLGKEVYLTFTNDDLIFLGD